MVFCKSSFTCDLFEHFQIYEYDFQKITGFLGKLLRNFSGFVGVLLRNFSGFMDCTITI